MWPRVLRCVLATTCLTAWLTVTLPSPVVAQNDLRPTADFALAALRVEPSQVLAGLAPSRVFLTVSNLGPNSTDADSTTLIIQYIVSPSPNPFDRRAINLTPLVVGIEGAGLDANAGMEVDFDALFRSDLALPPELEGEFHLFALGGPQSDAVNDPNLLNNLIAIETPIQVTPRKPSSHHLLFTKDDLQGLNAIAFRREASLGDHRCFAFNTVYGNSWRLTCRDGFFDCHFKSTREGPVLIRVRHLSSFASTAPGQGSSPITILHNGRPVVSEYDPAAHHGGTHDYVDDCWPIHAVQGTNTLTWRAGTLTSHYWIQSLEIVEFEPVDALLRAQRIAGSRIELSFPGSASGQGRLEQSTNLTSWSPVPDVPSGQGPWTLQLPLNQPRQFFRLVPCGP